MLDHTVHADLYLESTMDSVLQAAQLAARAASDAGFLPDDQQRIGLAVHESVLNAVSHGNQFSAEKKVHLVIRNEETKLVVEVEDEGDGFAPDEVPDPCDEGNLERGSGRGLLIIREYMDQLEVGRRSPWGARVRMAKRI
ncbi:MAG: ATP-binding protein [Bryobacteraceae bacterium]